MNWPLVIEQDRPEYPPSDICSYCRRNIGEEHARDCACVRKLVKIRFSFDVKVDVPDHWDEAKINAHFNKCSPVDMLYYIKKWAFEDSESFGENFAYIGESFKAECVGIIDDTPQPHIYDEAKMRRVIAIDRPYRKGGYFKRWPSEKKYGDIVRPSKGRGKSSKPVIIRASFELESDETYSRTPDSINALYARKSIIQILVHIKTWVEYRALHHEGLFIKDSYKCKYVSEAEPESAIKND